MLKPGVVRTVAGLAGVALLGVTLAALLTPNAQPVGISDDLGHLLLFGGLGFVVGAYRGAGDRRRVMSDLLLLLAALLVFATLSEVGQLWIEGREPERADWVADAAGSAGGLFSGALVGLMVVKRPRRRRSGG
ncbi:MAG: VanZ like family protein [Chloroflexi bacterium]|nr:MAG: VanZ like family protein [Chloroflexota bacterium]